MSGIADGELRGKVRWALEKHSGIPSSHLIHIAVENGVVQLWGEVSSAAEKAAAETAARSQPGTKLVVNSLTIVIGRSTAGHGTDLTEAVRTALAQAAGVRSGDVGVISTAHGVVRLIGHVAAVTEERSAVSAASAVPGVREVVSEIVIGEATRSEDVAVFDDAALTGMVNSAIAERGVTIYDEDNIVERGIAYLRGRITDARQGEIAEQAAAAVGGIQDTVNQLVVDHVLSSSDPDEVLAAKVISALRRDGRVSPAALHVECVRGDVHLFGAVGSIDDQNAALAVAKGVPGVRRVFNDILISDRTSLGSRGEKERRVGQEGPEQGR